MNSLLLESLPYIKIEDEIIDLDHEAEVVPVTTWDDKIRNMLTKSMDGKVPLEDLLKLYISSLRDQVRVSKDKSLLKDKILTHLNYFHIYYMELNDFLHLSNYYELIEDVLANYCTLELDLLRWKFPHRTKTKKKKHYLVEVKCAFHRIWTVVTTFLGQQEKHILHVLLKMQYRKFSEVTTETRRLLYIRVLFDKPVSDLSDEGLCRLWIIFQKVKEVVPPNQIEQLEKIFEVTYGAIELKRSSEIIRNVFYVKKNGSRIANLLHIKDRVVQNYFSYMKKKKQNEDQPLCDTYDEEALCEKAFGRNLQISEVPTCPQPSIDEVVTLDDDDDDDNEKPVVILSDNEEEEIIPKKNNKKLNKKNDCLKVSDDIINLESDECEEVMPTPIPLESTKPFTQLPTLNISESVTPIVPENPPKLTITDISEEKCVPEDLLTNSSKESAPFENPVQLIKSKNEKMDVAPPSEHSVDKVSVESEKPAVKMDTDSDKAAVNRDLSPVRKKDSFIMGLSVRSPKTINGKISRLAENCESELTPRSSETNLAPIQMETDHVCTSSVASNSLNENTSAPDNTLKTVFESLSLAINSNGSPHPAQERIQEIQSQFEKKILTKEEAVQCLVNEMKGWLTKKPEHVTLSEEIITSMNVKPEIEVYEHTLDSDLLVSIKSDPEDLNEDELLEESVEDTEKSGEDGNLNDTVQNIGSLEATYNDDNTELNNVNTEDNNVAEDNACADEYDDLNETQNSAVVENNVGGVTETVQDENTTESEQNPVSEIPLVTDFNVESIPEKELENICDIVEFIKAPLQFRSNTEETVTVELMDVFSEIAAVHPEHEQLDSTISLNDVMETTEKCETVEKQDKNVVQMNPCVYGMTPPSENYSPTDRENQKKIEENYTADKKKRESGLLTPSASEGKAESISEEHIYLGNLQKQTLIPQNVNESTDDYEDSLYDNDNYDSEVSTPDFKIQKDPIYKSFLNEHFGDCENKEQAGSCNGPISIMQSLKILPETRIRPKMSDTESSKSDSFGNCDKVLASVTMNDYITQKTSGKKLVPKETDVPSSRLDGFEAEFQDSLSGRITKINGTSHHYNNYSLFDCEKSDGNFVKPAWDATKVGSAVGSSSWPSVLKEDTCRADLESKQLYQTSSSSTSSSTISSPQFDDIPNKKGEYLEELNSLRKVNTVPKGILTTKSQSFPTPVASLLYDSDGETPYDRTKRKLEDKDEEPPKKKRVLIDDKIKLIGVNSKDYARLMLDTKVKMYDEVELLKKRLKSINDNVLNNHFTKTRCIIDRVPLEAKTDKEKEAESTVASPSRVPDPEKYLKEHPFTGRNGFLRGKTSRRGRAKISVGSPSPRGRGKRGRGRGRRRGRGRGRGRGATMNPLQDLLDLQSYFEHNNVQDT